MKAAYIRKHGGPEVIEIGERPYPSLEAGEVILRVKATGLNRLELYSRAGTRGTKLPDTAMPHILGGECAGEIVEIGSGVSHLSIGQRVVVNPHCGNQVLGTTRNGSNAEFVASCAENVIPIPDTLSFEQAAGLPTVYLPTWGIVIREGQLKKSETAVVLSSSSGVGTAAIQIIKGVVGAHCIAVTSSKEKMEKSLSLGADHAINYKEENIKDRIVEITNGHGADLVVDSTGAAFFEDAYASLARGGRFGICGVTAGYQSQIHLGQLFSKQLKLFGTFMGSMEELRSIVNEASAGNIGTHIHKLIALEELQNAHEEMEKSEHFGKFIVSLN
ncbi:MAG: hypothetical protein CL763_01575 [Chloroflexi bacterium]|nr:hypothetical protein [Chloroflexota bacterium]